MTVFMYYRRIEGVTKDEWARRGFNLPSWAILKTRSAHEKARHSKPCGTTAPPQSPIAPFVGPLPVSEVQRASILEANEIWLSNSEFRQRIYSIHQRYHGTSGNNGWKR